MAVYAAWSVFLNYSSKAIIAKAKVQARQPVHKIRKSLVWLRPGISPL